MKRKLKRVLSVILTLCMMFGMLPAQTIHVEAAGETYEMWLDMPYGSNDLLPNSQKKADVNLNVSYPDGSGYTMSKKDYTTKIVSMAKTSADDPDPSDLISVQFINPNRLEISANPNGLTGSCIITLAAEINSEEVARSDFYINVKNEIYEIPDVFVDGNGDIVNPGLWSELDLESLFVLKKLTYDHTNMSVSSTTIDLEDDSKYEVNINYNTRRWTKTDDNDTKGVFNLTRETPDNAEFIINVIEKNVGCLVEHSYEFEPLGYYVQWESNPTMQVYKDSTTDLHLDVNMPGKDYDVRFIFGWGPMSQGNTFDNPNKPLYSLYRFPDGKIEGLCVDGAAVAEVCPNGEFWIKVEGYVVDGTKSVLVSEEYLQQIQLLDSDGPSNPGNPGNPGNPSTPYTAEFNGNHFSVFNYENAKELYLDTQNIQTKDYEIEFKVGAFNPVDGFVPFNVNQSDLFDSITDINGKVTGISLNGAAIASVCDNGQFEVQVKLIIDDENYEWNFVQTVSLNRTTFWFDVMWNGPWPITVYEDATSAEILFDTSNFAQDVPNYDFAFEIGTMGANGPDDYAPLNVNPQLGDLFTTVVDNNGKTIGLDLNPARIRQIYGGEDFAIKADITVDGYVITTSHFGICLGSTAPSYWYNYGDSKEFPGNGTVIENEIAYEIRNSQNPFGVMGTVAVTDVTVRVTEGAADAVTVEKNQDNNTWDVFYNSLGAAEITITHETPDGRTEQYTYTVDVVDSIWKATYYNQDGLQNAVQGGSITLDVVVAHERWSEEKGVYTADTPYELEWAVNNPDLAPYVSFIPNADKTEWTLQVTQNAPEETYDFSYYVYELDTNGKRVTDSNGDAYPVTECFGRLVVMNNFPYLRLDGYTRDLEVGESITITPNARNRYLVVDPSTGNTVCKDEPLANAAYSLVYYDFDPDSLDIKDNGDGTYTVTRLASWEIGGAYIRVDAPFGNVGNTDDDFATENGLDFPKIDYTVSFKDLRGDNDATWLYDNEEYTLEVDTTNLAGKRANVTLDWYVVEWIDDENYNVITDGYSIDGNKITLDGEALAEQGLNALYIAAVVMSNGYETGDGAYVDVELLAYDPEAKIDDKEYLTLQDAIDDAVSGDTITLLKEVSIDGTIKIPAGLTVTLDLDGNDIIGTPTVLKAYEVIENKGNLTLQGNGSVICEHNLTGSTSYAVNTIKNEGALLIKDVAIENNSMAASQIGYAIDNNSTSYDAVLTIDGATVSVSGSYYYDGIRQFCNSLTKENSVTIKSGTVSSIWLQNPSDSGSNKNTKDVKGSIAILGGNVTAVYLEPSTAFEAAITDGVIGSVSSNESAADRDLAGFITGGTFATEVPEEYCASGVICAPVQNGTETNYVAHTHVEGETLVKTDAAEADCEENGNIAYWTCSVCDRIYSDATATTEITAAQTVIGKTGHSLTKTYASAATCVTDGNITYWTCGACPKIFSDAEGKTEIAAAQIVITATGKHTYLDGICTMCEGADPDYKPDEKVEMGTTDSMKDTLAGEAANITNGIDTTTGKLSEDVKVDEETKEKIEEIVADTSSDDSVTLVFVVEQVATPIEETEVAPEETTAIETKLEEAKQEIAEESVEEVESQGVVQYLDLSVVIKAQIQSNDASEETKTTTMGKLEETSEEMEFTISVPDEYLQPGYEIFVLRSHEGQVDKLPLTHVEGNLYSFKTNLFSTYALAYVSTHVHTETIINAVDSDCGNDGYTGDKVCSTCNTVLEKGKTIHASGNHNWSEWKNQEGIAYTFRECWGCGASEYLNADVPVASTPTTGTASPATGDTSNVFGWLMLMAACCGVVLTTMVYRKKEQ